VDKICWIPALSKREENNIQHNNMGATSKQNQWSYHTCFLRLLRSSAGMGWLIFYEKNIVVMVE